MTLRSALHRVECILRVWQAFGVEYGFLRAGPVSGESFGKQEAVGSDAQAGMVMKPAPATAFVVVKSEFLLEFLVVTFNAPALVGCSDQFGERTGLRQCR